MEKFKVIKVESMGSTCVFSTDAVLDVAYDLQCMMDNQDEFKVTFPEMTLQEYEALIELNGW